MKLAVLVLFFLGFNGFFSSCSRSSVKRIEDAMRVTKSKNLQDLKVPNFITKAIIDSVGFLKKNPHRVMRFRHCEIEASKYAEFLLKLPKTKKELIQYLKKDATWFEVYGRDDWSEILLTSYFSPLLEARKTPQGPYTQPIYNVPLDLVEVSLNHFDSEDLVRLVTDRDKVSGRIVKGPGIVRRVVPYFSRQEIDGEKKLKGRGLEIAYLRPIDAFFLQIQGSGKIKFKNGEVMSLGYGAQNGYRYQSIGKLLYHVIPKEEMSMAKIQEYLKNLSREQLYQFLAQNPSYVFFKNIKREEAKTTSGIKVYEMLTLAVDSRIFPLGSFGILKHPIPYFTNDTESVPYRFKEETRVIFAHDTGGAIKGVDRADLFWGHGKDAQQSAGVIKHKANLWFLTPKSCQSSS